MNNNTAAVMLVGGAALLSTLYLSLSLPSPPSLSLSLSLSLPPPLSIDISVLCVSLSLSLCLSLSLSLCLVTNLHQITCNNKKKKKSLTKNITISPFSINSPALVTSLTLQCDCADRISVPRPCVHHVPDNCLWVQLAGWHWWKNGVPTCWKRAANRYRAGRLQHRPWRRANDAVSIRASHHRGVLKCKIKSLQSTHKNDRLPCLLNKPF